MERKHLKQLNTCVDYMSNLHFIYIPMNLRLTDHKHRFIAAIKKIFPWSVFNVCVQCVWQSRVLIYDLAHDINITFTL